MKKGLEILVITFFCVMTVAFQQSVIAKADDTCKHGYHTMSDRYLKSITGKKHGKRLYYIQKEFNDIQKGYIATGIRKWNIYKNVLNLESASKKSKANIVCRKRTLGANINGICEFKDVDTYSNGYPCKNYSKTYISIDVSNTGSGILLMKVATHETGHSLGLTHVTKKKSVMYPNSGSSYFVENPQSVEKKSLYHLYH